MSLCINPRCNKPENPDNDQFCQNCQSPLLLKQRYRATKVLGEGGFGKTYAASDLGTPNKVIKVLINNSPKAVELFQREAEVLSQLNNPGIPRVEPNSYIIFHPADGQEPIHCLVMEKIQGDNLRDYLKQLRQSIDSETAERWLKELVLILQEVHKRGILHRDIKPQNIIFKPDGRLTLIDFGAVREGTGTEVATGVSSGSGTEVASHMAGGTSVVSRSYTAPEQMNGEALKQSDFYSLGRTFIFLLTGKEPSEISYDAYNDVLQWHKYAPNVEPKLAELLDQMQSTQVKKRPANAQDLLRSLNSRRTSASPDAQSRSTYSSSSASEYVVLDNAPLPKAQPRSTAQGEGNQERQGSSAPPTEVLIRDTSGMFWKWFGATFVGYIFGFIAFFVVILIIAAATTGSADTAILDRVTQTRWSSGLAWGVFGLILGTLQWFVLRKRVPKASDWISATIYGYTLYGFLMAASKSMSFSSTASIDPLRDVGIALCGGVLIGLAQWLHYLRKYIPGSGWWVILVITSSTIGSVMGIASPTLVLFGLLIDPALTGWGMNRLLKQYLENT
jgi:serine/threonine protein kinase